MQITVGLFFGTFNPIHVGHLILAEHMVQSGQVDKVWFVVSPKSPFKKKDQLLADHHRLYLTRLATEDDDRFWVSDVEMKLPKPSYTIVSLLQLQTDYPQHHFKLIIGEDNLRTFTQWRNYEQILEQTHLLVYPRSQQAQEKQQLGQPISPAHYSLVNAPLLPISSSYIRTQIASGKTVNYLLTAKVAAYIDEMNFYRG